MSGETGGRLTDRAVVDAILACLPLSLDGTGHVVDCGYTDDTPSCGCYTLPGRIAGVLAARADANAAAVARVEALAEHLGTDTHDCFKPWCPTCSVIKRERQIKADMLAALHPDPSERGGE